MLINLMVNAVQAMETMGTAATAPGGERVLVLDTGVDAARSRVAITVQDSGPGLSEATRAALFQPFFTTRRDGNGLGLWISRGLLERYGGTLQAGNRAGGGAVFTIELPAG